VAVVEGVGKVDGQVKVVLGQSPQPKGWILVQAKVRWLVKIGLIRPRRLVAFLMADSEEMDDRVDDPSFSLALCPDPYHLDLVLPV
jgi:hypothetical protein